MDPSRRHFLQAGLVGISAGMLGLPLSAKSERASNPFSPTSKLPFLEKEISIQRISIKEVKADNRIYHFIEVVSPQGKGIFPANNKLPYMMDMMRKMVVPYFLGKDARQLADLVEGVYRAGRNYKYAGMPFWNCVASVELAILDMLGKIEEVPVYDLFGEKIREEVPLYVSTFDRVSQAEKYVEDTLKKVEVHGAKSVKFKIGGRMSNNQDCLPGRNEALIPLARKTFGDDFTIYVDANGSYDAAHAIEVGKLLEDHQVAFYEEPCPWQNFEQTAEVSKALFMDVAGGEQDNSLPMFKHMIGHEVVNIIQPDLMYAGGFHRVLKIAEMAAKQGIPITLHNPRFGAQLSAGLHFAAITPHVGPYQEYNPDRRLAKYATPDLMMRDGKLSIPQGAGWGITYDQNLWRNVIEETFDA